MRRLASVCILALAVIPAACGRKERTAPSPNVANRVAVRQVRLFFGSPSMMLRAEPRNVPLPENPSAALPMVLRELMKGPAAAGTARLLPADAVVRGAWLLPEGNVVVDLGGPTLAAGWGTGSHQELLAIHSIVLTAVENFPDARRVRLLVNGSPAETLGGHIALDRAFLPKSGMVDGTPAAKR